MKKHRILKPLCKNNNIISLRQDKGICSDIIYGNVYIRKICHITRDSLRFLQNKVFKKKQETSKFLVKKMSL